VYGVTVDVVVVGVLCVLHQRQVVGVEVVVELHLCGRVLGLVADRVARNLVAQSLLLGLECA